MKVTVKIDTLGDYFLYKMRERKVSTRDVAKEISLSPSTVWRISQGMSFKIENLIPVAKWCGLSADELWNLLSCEKGKKEVPSHLISKKVIVK